MMCAYRERLVRAASGWSGHVVHTARPTAPSRLVKGLAVYVGLNGLYIASWPFIGLYYMLFTNTRVFMGFAGMFICILIGGLMIKAPLQVFRAYSKTALAGVILGTVIGAALNGIMVLG